MKDLKLGPVLPKIKKAKKNPKSKGDLSKIKSISREKLSELRNLFNEQLIDKDEYDD